MEGRRYSKIVLMLVFGLSSFTGCRNLHPKQNNLLNSSNSSITNSAAPAPNVAMEDPRDKKPVSPETLLIYADQKVNAAKSQSPPRTPLEQESLLNDARIMYQNVLKQYPKNVGAYRGLANVYFENRDTEKGLEICQKGLKIDKTDTGLWLIQAKIQSRLQHNYPAALDSVRQLVQLKPEDKSFQRHLGRTLVSAGHIDEGYQILRKSCSDVQARQEIGTILFSQNRFEEAKQQFSTVLQNEPQNSYALDMIVAIDNRNNPSALSPTNTINDNNIQQTGYQSFSTNNGN